MARLVALFSVVMLSCGACGGGDDGDTPTLRVFAASSLIEVLPDIVAAYGDSNVELNFAGSSALREQILDGAAADIFISASTSVMDGLAAAGAITGDPVAVAANSMVIVVPRGSTDGIDGLAGFAEPQRTIGLCSPGVPCGDLAIALFEAASVDPSVDTYEQNVRALLAKVELGELDAALVYRTDANGSDLVDAIEPEQLQSLRTIYVAAILDGADSGADPFISYLGSPAVREILNDAGFEAP